MKVTVSIKIEEDDVDECSHEVTNVSASFNLAVSNAISACRFFISRPGMEIVRIVTGLTEDGLMDDDMPEVDALCHAASKCDEAYAKRYSSRPAT